MHYGCEYCCYSRLPVPFSYHSGGSRWPSGIRPVSTQDRKDSRCPPRGKCSGGLCTPSCPTSTSVPPPSATHTTTTDYLQCMLLLCNTRHTATMSISLSLSLSLRFNGHFPGEPGLAGVYWSKGWWRRLWQMDCWSYKSCKAPVKSTPPTNQQSVFYRPDDFPVAQPTVLKYWRENIIFHGLAYSRLTWGSSNFVSDH